MARRRESTVFFPWEKKRGLLGVVGRARGRLLLSIVALIAFVVLVWGREEHAAALRATRATLTTTTRAVTAYRADHGGKCPASLSDLVAGGYTRDVPIDAWGRPLRLTCPGRRDAASFEVSSDGPDGLPGGLDRVE
ncbi:type II secretion system protein GspG [Pendulispora brunnea]|uniref:Type II secretion system protein GspG n=1 Tax=Pendulispora brunnea TaxID=2905690 RepID=A0ABZ2KHP3_9BACT